MKKHSSRALVFFILLAAAFLAVALAATKKRAPLRRLQQIEQELSDEEMLADRNDRRMRKQEHIARILQTVGTPDKLGFLNKAKLDSVDPVALFKGVLDSDALEPLYRNVEMVHRLVESVPVIKSLPGFQQLADRKLNNEQTIFMFKEAMKDLMEFAKTASVHAKDPTRMADMVQEIYEEADDATKEMIRLAKDGDAPSQQGVHRIMMAKLYPGMDFDMFHTIHESMNFDYILSQPTLSRFIDQDPYVSDVIRNDMTRRQ